MYSKVFKNSVHKGMPFAVSVEPNNTCNLFCIECPTGLNILQRPKGRVSLPAFKNIVDQIKERTVMVNLYFQGEPFLNKDLIKLIQYSKKKGLVVSTSTNAHFINEEIAKDIVQSGLDELYISLDGVDQEAYGKYRLGGDINSVVRSIKNLVAAKRKYNSNYPVIRSQMLVFSHNEHQVERFKELSYSLGVDVADIKTAQIYNVENKSHLIPKSKKYSRYTNDSEGKFRINGEVKNSCWKHWSSCVVTWDGKVVPCCFDKDAAYVLGNVLGASFVDIWRSGKYDRFRRNILNRQNQVEMCKNCPLSRG